MHTKIGSVGGRRGAGGLKAARVGQQISVSVRLDGQFYRCHRVAALPILNC